MKKQIVIGVLALTLVNFPIKAEEIESSEHEIIDHEETVKQSVISSQAEITVYIDGKEQKYAVKPYIENGYTLVPMRSIFETLGAEVHWIEHSNTVIATKQDIRVEIKIGSYFAKLNDEIVKLNVQPKLIEGTAMVPLRFVSEALGAKIEWDGETRTIQITSSQFSQINDEKENEENLNEEVTSTAENSKFRNTLTYEEAVEMALNQSHRLKIDNESIRRTEVVRDLLSESHMYSTPIGHGLGQEDFLARQSLLGLAKTDIGLGMAKKQVTITEEVISFQVKSAMDEILSTHIELEFIEDELKHMEQELELARIKEEHGLESQFNLLMTRTSLEEGYKQKGMLEKKLDRAYLHLNQLIGKPDEERYEITGSATFEPMPVIDLDAHVHRVTSQDPYVWFQEMNIKQAELGLALYTYNAGQEPYAAIESDVRTEKARLMALKANLDESIRSRYNDIQQLEKQYEVLEVNLKKAEDALNLVRTQYDAGLAIDAQLEEAKLTVERIKAEMKKLAFTHEQLKILFNKPYLAPDYLN